jgi:8-oxo-dGTP pyrophosphatase MutT (NUDIX family)
VWSISSRLIRRCAEECGFRARERELEEKREDREVLHDSSFLGALRRRLASPLPGLTAQMRMSPRPRLGADSGLDVNALRPAAALLLLYSHDDAWHVPLTVRGSTLRHHTGQVSLPGGRLDPGESVEEAALREAHEEVGVIPSEVEVLGRLTPLPVYVSGHLLHPVVGFARQRPRFNLAAHEVERLIEVPVALLRVPGNVLWEERLRILPPQGVMNVPYFDVLDARVWGATAMVLAEFVALVEEVEKSF